MNFARLFQRQAPQRASGTDLEGTVRTLKDRIAELKRDSGNALNPALVRQLEEAAADAETVLDHRRAITNEIVTPVTRELRVGKVFVWLGLAFSVFGLLTADITSENTLLGRGFKWFSAGWTPLDQSSKFKELIRGFEEKNSSTDVRAEFDNATRRIVEALEEGESGMPQLKLLMKDLAEKVLNNPKEPFYRSLHYYAHVATTIHGLHNHNLARELLASRREKLRSDLPYVAIIELYAIDAVPVSDRLRKLGELVRSEEARKMGDLRFISPQGKLTTWEEAISTMRVSAIKERFVSTGSQVVFINDSYDRIRGLAARFREQFLKLSGLPPEAARVDPVKVSNTGADKLYLYFRSEADQDAYGTLLSKMVATELGVETSIYPRILNTEVRKLFSEDRRVAIVVRLPGED